MALKCPAVLDQMHWNENFGQICGVLSGAVAATARGGMGDGRTRARKESVVGGHGGRFTRSGTYLIFIEGVEEAEMTTMSVCHVFASNTRKVSNGE